MMPKLPQLIQNSSRLFIADICNLVVTLVQGILIARFLGASGYGLLTLVVAYVAIVNQFVDFRIREAVVKYISEFQTKKDGPRVWATIKLCYIIDLSTGIIAFLLVIISAGIASSLVLHNTIAEGLIRLYALTLLFATVDGTSLGILTVFEKFSWIALYSVSSALIKLGCVIPFLFAGSGIEGVLVAYVVATCLSSIILLILARAVIRTSVWYKGLKGEIGLLWGRAREIAGFLFNTNINESLSLVTKNIDVLILGFFRASVEVGYYRMAKNFAEILSMLSNPVYVAIYPRLSRMWGGAPIAELKELIKRVTIFMAGISLPIALAIGIAAPGCIRYFAGVSFMPAVLPVRIMLWGALIPVILVWIRPLFLSMGRPGILTIINLANALTMCIFSLWLVPRFGYLGSSFMYIYPYLFGHVIALFILIKILRRAQ